MVDLITGRTLSMNYAMFMYCLMLRHNSLKLNVHYSIFWLGSMTMLYVYIYQISLTDHEITKTTQRFAMHLTISSDTHF